MKIALVAESPSMPSGFGNQTRLLCESFGNLGHEIFLLAASVPMRPLPIKNVTEWRYNDIRRVDLIDRDLSILKPDVTLIFQCTSFVANFLDLVGTPSNCPTFYWLPYEGSVLPVRANQEFFGVPDNTIIHLSNFARHMWMPIFSSDLIIPHAVDKSIWKYDPNFGLEEKNLLRRKWAERLKFPIWDDDYVIINFDRNIWHKRWDATYDYISKLKKRLDKRVVLIAHAKRIQGSEKGHATGFDLNYLESMYSLNNSVCYTDFDWMKSLTREEMVELVRISDFRVSTSSGEGFGIGNIEVGALGHPQIVNNQTTMPELLGQDNSMLVEPAMLEEKMGSLWPIPNTNSMVDRTLGFIDNPETLESATYTARLLIEEQFDIDVVANKFLNLFANSIIENTKENLKYSYPWGFRKQKKIYSILGDLARSIKTISDDFSVLEIGCFQGWFLDIALELGITIIGVEQDEKALSYVPTRARPFVAVQNFIDPWPLGNTVVATDMQDIWFRLGNPEEAKTGLEIVTELCERIASYKWAFLRFEPRYSWGEFCFDPRMCRSVLLSKGMVRDEALETALRSKFVSLDHEIWRSSSIDTTDLLHTCAQSEKA